MDTDMIKRHFERIGARAQVRVGGPASRRVDGDGIVRLDVVQDRYGELFDFRVTPLSNPRVEVLQMAPSEHRLLLLTQSNEKADKNKFLCGFDERHWFVAAVPGRSVGTIRSAMDALRPVEASAVVNRFALSMNERHSRKNAAFRRQGEWFFVPAEGISVDPTKVLQNEPISRARGKPHWIEFGYRTGGEQVYVTHRFPLGIFASQYRMFLSRNREARKWQWQIMRRNPALYAKGRVRHSDHATIVLNEWHRVLMNRENEVPAMRHVAFLD